METMETNSFREAWNETCLRAGLSSLSLDTAARISAVLHVESGCTTAVTFSPKLRADLKYIKMRFGLYGGGHPDHAFVRRFRHYVKEIEAHQKLNRGNTSLSKEEQAWPEWARTLYLDAYNVNLTAVFVYTSEEEEQAALRALSGRSKFGVL